MQRNKDTTLELTKGQLEKLTDQKTQMQQISNKFMTETKTQQKTALDNNDKDEFIRLNEAKAKVLGEHSTLADASLTQKILTRHQVNRLQEIRLQAEGPKAFERAEIQEGLGLTAEQVADIRKIIFEGMKEYRKAASLPPSTVRVLPKSGVETKETEAYTKSSNKALNNMASVRVAMMQSIEKILLKAQRAKYKRMIGEPFMFNISSGDPVTRSKETQPSGKN